MNKKILGGILTSIFLLALLTTFFILKTTHTPKNNAIPAENTDNNVAIDNTKPDTNSPDYETYKKIRTAAQELVDAANSYHDRTNQSKAIIEKFGVSTELTDETFLSEEYKDLCTWQLPEDTKYNQQLTMAEQKIFLYCVDEQQKVLIENSIHFKSYDFEKTEKFYETIYYESKGVGEFDTVVEHPAYYHNSINIPSKLPFSDGDFETYNADTTGGHLSNNPPKENESLLEYTQRIRTEKNLVNQN